MSESAYDYLCFALRLACTSALCALGFLLHNGECRSLFLTARELYASAGLIVLLGVIGSVLLEERARR